MAFDPNSFLLPISPPGKMDFTDAIQSAMQLRAKREELRRMREAMEETKRHNREAEAIARLNEQGDMARAQLSKKQQEDKDAAEAQRQLDERRRGTLEEVGKLGQNYGAIRALAPRFNGLGMGFEDQGSDEQGNPRFRITMDAAADARAQAQRDAQVAPRGPDETVEQSLERMQGLGYPDNEQGNLDDLGGADRAPPTLADQMVTATPQAGELDAATAEALSPGDADLATASQYGGEGEADVSVGGRGLQEASLPFGDAYAQALAAGRYARAHGGIPARGPDQADLTGGIPNDVIDFGSIAATNAPRTKALLDAAVKARPDAVVGDADVYRDSATSTAGGVVAQGLDPLASAKLFGDLQQPVDTAINANVNALAQQDRQQAGRQVTRTEEAALVDRGYSRAQKSYKDNKIGESVNTLKSADTVVSLLTDDDPNNDALAINFLMALSHNKGAQTEKDAERMTGLTAASALEEIQAWLHQKIEGGFYPDLKEAMVGFAKRLQGEDENTVFGYMSDMERQAGANRDPLIAQGYRDYLDTIQLPKSSLERYRKMREDADQGGTADPDAVEQPTGATDDFDTELLAQAAEAGLDADKIAPLVRHESGGDPTAKSSAGASGVMQIMPEHLRAMGIEPEAFRKLSAVEQVPYIVRYFKSVGIDENSSPDDYALAVAASAPKWRTASDDTVIYPKDTDPKSAWSQNPGWRPPDGGDITKRSILAFYGLRDKGDAAAGGKLPEPKTALEKELFDALGGKL